MVSAMESLSFESIQTSPWTVELDGNGDAIVPYDIYNIRFTAADARIDHLVGDYNNATISMRAAIVWPGNTTDIIAH